MIVLLSVEWDFTESSPASWLPSVKSGQKGPEFRIALPPGPRRASLPLTQVLTLLLTTPSHGPNPAVTKCLFGQNRATLLRLVRGLRACAAAAV